MMTAKPSKAGSLNKYTKLTEMTSFISPLNDVNNTTSEFPHFMDANLAHLMNSLFSLSKKFTFYGLNIWFLSKCAKMHIVPDFIKVSANLHTKAASRAVDTAKSTWLKLEIQKWYSARDSVSLDLYWIRGELAARLHPVEWSTLDSCIRERVFALGEKKKILQSRKLSRLASRTATVHPPRPSLYGDPVFHPKVINLSSTTLSNNEHSLLEKGLKHCPPTQFSSTKLKQLCIQTDTNISTSNNMLDAKYDIASALSRDKTITSYCKNSHHEMTTAKQLLKKATENNLTITKADKGNTVVILDTQDYNDKINEFLNDENIEKIPKDPTNKLLVKLRTELKDSPALFTKPRYFIPSNPAPPRLYGLPKIHKENIPIRPVVSYTNTITHRLAHRLNNLFHEHVHFKPLHTIKNSLELVTKLQDIQIPANAKLISFDVTNLFPSTPTQDCKLILQNILDKATCPVPIRTELYNLISLCIDTNYFMFNNSFYKQNSGLPMGSPLSPLLADIFMDNFETLLLETQHPLLQNLTYWYRYVDDILALWTGTTRQLDLFVEFLNSRHPSIKFTSELENEYQSINFLDLTISRVDNKHIFNVFRKPTHTDTVIHNTSQHPSAHKHAAFHAMIHRLVSLPLSQDNFQRETHTIKYIATANGYSTTLVDNILRRKLNKKKLKTYTSLAPLTEKPSKFISIPFFGKISQKVAHILHKYNFQVSFTTHESLKHLLSPRNTTPLMAKSGVYELHCHNCEAKYIGQTGRSFNARLKEHLHAWKYNTNRSHFATHLINTGHTFHPDSDIKILEIENKFWNRSALEIFHIFQAKQKSEALLNEQTNFPLSPLLIILRTSPPQTNSPAP